MMSIRLQHAKWMRAAAVLAFTANAAIAIAHEASPVQADFVPPAPGTYQLERIQKSPAGLLLDVNAKRVALEEVTQKKITLLALMYTSCNDAKGCPLAYHTMYLVRKELAKLPQSKHQVQLVSLSFDPERDTPQAMRRYATEQAAKNIAVPWSFYTTASKKDIAPILDAFGQDVSVPTDPDAAKLTGELSHVLKVFLIDREGWVREIYTTAFLVPKVILNDVQTLLLETKLADAKKHVKQ